MPIAMTAWGACAGCEGRGVGWGIYQILKTLALDVVE